MLYSLGKWERAIEDFSKAETSGSRDHFYEDTRIVTSTLSELCRSTETRRARDRLGFCLSYGIQNKGRASRLRIRLNQATSRPWTKQ